MSVEIKYDDKLPEEGGAFVQAALLYTSVGKSVTSAESEWPYRHGENV